MNLVRAPMVDGPTRGVPTRVLLHQTNLVLQVFGLAIAVVLVLRLGLTMVPLVVVFRGAGILLFPRF